MNAECKMANGSGLWVGLPTVRGRGEGGVANRQQQPSPKMQYCDFITQIAYNHPKTTKAAKPKNGKSYRQVGSTMLYPVLNSAVHK